MRPAATVRQIHPSSDVLHVLALQLSDGGLCTAASVRVAPWARVPDRRDVAASRHVSDASVGTRKGRTIVRVVGCRIVILMAGSDVADDAIRQRDGYNEQRHTTDGTVRRITTDSDPDTSACRPCC